MKKIDMLKLEKELQSKWYPQAEIAAILLWAENINKKEFFTLEEVHKSLFKKKLAHVAA